jgi:hypothetical protein
MYSLQGDGKDLWEGQKGLPLDVAADLVDGGGQLVHLHRGLAALNCTPLHCTALHCTRLYCTALHCTALNCTALHSAQWGIPLLEVSKLLHCIKGCALRKRLHHGTQGLNPDG